MFDLTNLIFPLILFAAGVVITSQTFARLVSHNPDYTGVPFYIFSKNFLFLPAGYRLYNPGTIFLTIVSNPFDPYLNSILFNVYLPLLVSTAFAVLLYFVISIVRAAGMNKNDNLYGTARWGTEKDLKKFGLLSAYGVVLAELQKARVDFKINPKNSSISLLLKKSAPLVCHQGGTNTLMIAPTRSGKGVGSVIPTCLYFPESMIIFDPKGELYLTTAGFRSQFSHILKFSPISRDTLRFNPLEEVELDEMGFADIGLILSNMFEEPKGGNDGTNSFFENNAQDFLTGVIFHIISCKLPKYKNKKNLAGVLWAISEAAGDIEGEGEDKETGGALIEEMLSTPHFNKDNIDNPSGKPDPMIHKIITNVANRCKGQNPKVRSDVFSTIFAKMRLFEDPNLAYVTGASDFKLQDFYDSNIPISLYLTVPFSDITRVAPVFKMLINFILTKFSRGEATYGEIKLKHRILFMLDEFPVLGAFPFLSKTMGILAGYGITFYIIVQALNQIVDIYGQNHTFLDNCKTVVVYAPGTIEDAKMFSEMIGKESVTKESVSTSGSRFSISLDNLNMSSQDIARELINPDELMKLPPSDALIINQGMPPYLAKKVVYYMDKRFKGKAYSPSAKTGIAPPLTRAALLAGARHPEWGLPSQKGKLSGAAKQTAPGLSVSKSGSAVKETAQRAQSEPETAAAPLIAADDADFGGKAAGAERAAAADLTWETDDEAVESVSAAAAFEEELEAMLGKAEPPAPADRTVRREPDGAIWAKTAKGLEPLRALPLDEGAAV
jgi:type IV secretion system protein VirD4